ncbi:hemerythrin domain-containing protein [Actinoplanes sp. CA-030573]|uniref:hemerythrin domain-containing protein n=1 Tax=Actinoplanes sp. CA-030573 TaxID=3239898 RepID=UPI003D8F2139
MIDGPGTGGAVSSLNLPPLPPVGGETTGRNVIDVLGRQHRDLLDLCDRLVAAKRTPGEDDDRRVAGVLVAELSRHLSAEEQYLYPAIRRVVPGGEDLAARELAEDRELLVLLQRLEKDITVIDEIAEAVRRHVAADAEELLPVLAEMVPIDDLIRLGNRVETAEEAAPTRPHPGTPSSPPWNKLVDPAVAVVDKLRDVVTGRTTYLSDL